ncbi:MAG: hypothetical protein U0835_13550 [Isosphaeraceae bacterium]
MILTDEQKTQLFVGRLPAMADEISRIKIDVFMRWRAERYTELREAGIVRLGRLERALDRALLDVLTSDQRRRLDEIALQQAGPLFVAKPEGARLLGLGFPQVERIQAIIAESEASIESEMKTRLGPPAQPTAFEGKLTDEQRAQLLAAQARRNAGQKITYQVEAKAIIAVRRVLTGKQRERYDRLLGKPFDLRRLTLQYHEAARNQIKTEGSRPGIDPGPLPD